MSNEEFDRVVDEAMAALPDDLREVLAGCAVIVDDWADDALREELGGIEIGETPYGLYDGTPVGERVSSDPTPHLPDRILLFRGPLLEDFPDREELAEQIVITLMHELGHMIGFDEDDLEERGLQ